MVVACDPLSPQIVNEAVISELSMMRWLLLSSCLRGKGMDTNNRRTINGNIVAAAPAETQQPQGSGMLGGLGDMLGGIFGTSKPRGHRLSTGQAVAREVTRTVVNRVAGQLAAELGKSLGGRTGSSIGRAIVRGTLGGVLRR